MEPPNKGHVGDNNINSAVLSFIERLPSYRGSKCTKTIGNVNFGTSNSVLYRDTVSLFRRVHYRRFHCSYSLVLRCAATCILVPVFKTIVIIVLMKVIIMSKIMLVFK